MTFEANQQAKKVSTLTEENIQLTVSSDEYQQPLGLENIHSYVVNLVYYQPKKRETQ